jgi:hypothetical protein
MVLFFIENTAHISLKMSDSLLVSLLKDGDGESAAEFSRAGH